MEIFKDSKIIWSYLRKYKGKVYLIIFLAIVSAGIAAVIPYLYGRLVDIAILRSTSLELIGEVLLLWLVLAALRDWLQRLFRNKSSYVTIDAYNDFFLNIINHLLDLPLTFHKNKKMGEIIQRVQRGAGNLEMIVDQVVFNIGPNFLTVIISLIIMGFIELRLALLLFFVLVFYSLVTIWKMNPMIKIQKRMNEAYERAHGNVYDSVLNVQTVKSFTNENSEKKKLYKGLWGKAGILEKSLRDLWRCLSAWQQTILNLGFVSIFAGAVMMLRSGIITPGQLVMFIGYVYLSYSPFYMLAMHYRRVKTGLIVIKRARKLLNVEAEPYQKDKKELKNIKGGVEFFDINFGYQKNKNVLRDINFKVEPGQMVALVGESGVGKTTLIDLISRYYFPKQGKILVDDKDISEVSLESLRKNIAIVPQEVILFNDTIKNNIRYGRPRATEKEIIQASKAAHVDEFVKKFDKKYEQLVGERGIKLSTGQKQRVAIARAILRDPKILILDEATSSLDSATEKLVQDALACLIKGRTTFVIAHRLSTIQKADLILVLEKGRIVEEGDHQELISKGGVYKELSKLQSTIVK